MDCTHSEIRLLFFVYFVIFLFILFVDPFVFSFLICGVSAASAPKARERRKKYAYLLKYLVYIAAHETAKKEHEQLKHRHFTQGTRTPQNRIFFVGKQKKYTKHTSKRVSVEAEDET